MDLKKTLTAQGLKLMSDPRVIKLMQDERFMKMMMTAMTMPGRVQGFAGEQRDTLVDTLGVATRQEIDDLRREVQELRDQVESLRDLLETVLSPGGEPPEDT